MLAAAGALFGQAAPRLEFEVATVKPSPPINGFVRIGPRLGPGTADPSRVSYQYLSLKNLLATAYDVKNFQITGPGWLDSEQYDVVATVPPGATKEQVNVMLQNLLADRFQLTLHHETKDAVLYELTVGKNGSKLKPFVADSAAPATLPPPGGGPLPMGKDGIPVVPPGATLMMMSPKGRRVVARKQSIAGLINVLASELNSPILDKTGLTGAFDYSLEFMPEGGGALPGLPPPPPPPPGVAGPQAPGTTPADNIEAPTLLAAVQDQLGLKLEKKRGPLDILVIDHAEKVPTEN
jgi:uncharacterized protein (TIGR03435 family)